MNDQTCHRVAVVGIFETDAWRSAQRYASEAGNPSFQSLIVLGAIVCCPVCNAVGVTQQMVQRDGGGAFIGSPELREIRGYGRVQINEHAFDELHGGLGSHGFGSRRVDS
jgi:hypothetical protein